MHYDYEKRRIQIHHEFQVGDKVLWKASRKTAEVFELMEFNEHSDVFFSNNVVIAYFLQHLSYSRASSADLAAHFLKKFNFSTLKVQEIKTLILSMENITTPTDRAGWDVRTL